MVDEQHPATDLPLDSLRTLTLGLVAGLRGVMPFAVLARQLGREGADIADGGWALELLARRGVGLGLGLAAAGELVADKLPWTPSRLQPLPLAGRVVAGGTAAALQSLAEGRASDRGALLGCLGAILGSLAGYWLRTGLGRALPVPGVAVALAEDGLAIGLGVWAVAR